MKKDIAYSKSEKAFWAFKEDFEEYKKATKTSGGVSAWDTLAFCRAIERKKVVIFKIDFEDNTEPYCFER